MSLKKSAAFVLTILVLFFLGKNVLMLSAVENSGYIVLINDENSPISFAGMQYSLSDDLKNLFIEFQMTDIHTYKGKQGIRFSVICGNNKDEIFVNTDSLTRTDTSFFSLKNTLNKVDVFISHSNLKMAFELSFNKKITENLILEAVFIDASGAYTDKTACVLYSAQEPSKSTTETKESTSVKAESSSHEKETNEDRTTITSSQKSPQYSSDRYNADSYNPSHSQVCEEITVADLGSEVDSDFHDNQGGTVGIRQVVAVILAVFLLIAAFAFIILGIKKSKVT